MFYAAKSDGTLYSKSSTANGLGYWFAKNGTVSAYASGYVFSEFDASSLTFTIGQYPGKSSTGDTYTICEALKYKTADGETATALFIFNITIGPAASATLTDVEYDEATALAIQGVTPDQPAADSAFYDLLGRKVATPARGIYIHGGKKVYVK